MGPVRLLVLGGTAFVGRIVVDAALARGWSVATFNRGLTGDDVPGAEAIRGDRENPGDVARAVAAGPWDAPPRCTFSTVEQAIRSPQQAWPRQRPASTRRRSTQPRAGTVATQRDSRLPHQRLARADTEEAVRDARSSPRADRFSRRHHAAVEQVWDRRPVA